MRRFLHILPLLFALSAAAQTRTIDGIVKTADGAPMSGLTVAVTLLPIDAAEDITATSASACGGATTVDVYE